MEEFGLKEVFPKLDQVPSSVADTLREMIEHYMQAKEKKAIVQLIFPQKKEAAVFLLDHPPGGHRSTCQTCLGLSGVPPTVFIRTEDKFGCLVKYVNHDQVVADIINDMETVPEEIQRICITHIHFGCTDAHEANTLGTRDEKGIYRFTVIDNEECFTNFNLRVLWADENFSTVMVKYVRDLNVDRDISFLKSCGWEPPTTLINHFKIFTHFLKLAVECRLKPKDIGFLATGKYKKHRGLNLQEMVNAADRRSGDEEFVKSAYKKVLRSMLPKSIHAVLFENPRNDTSKQVSRHLNMGV